nr:HEPN domain-containing protein [Sansalvadorimonas sp. 2012CJ34-2]
MRNIDHIRQISKSNIDTKGNVKEHLLGLLYVNVITAIETYLSDAFINEVLNDKDKLIKFVETNPEFSERTFKLSEVFKKHSEIEKEVKNYLLGLMWHNIKKIKPMFKDALDVDFPKDLSLIFKAILKRHDLVHRGGKNKDGESVVVSDEELSTLVQTACQFIESINDQIIGVEEFEF